MKSKLTDEDIPDLADMLGEKLFKVSLVVFKVILGLQPLDKAAMLLDQTRLVFWQKVHEKKTSFLSKCLFLSANMLFLLANMAAVTSTANQQFFFLFSSACFSSRGRSNEADAV